MMKMFALSKNVLLIYVIFHCLHIYIPHNKNAFVEKLIYGVKTIKMRLIFECIQDYQRGHFIPETQDLAVIFQVPGL